SEVGLVGAVFVKCKTKFLEKSKLWFACESGELKEAVCEFYFINEELRFFPHPPLWFVMNAVLPDFVEHNNFKINRDPFPGFGRGLAQPIPDGLIAFKRVREISHEC